MTCKDCYHYDACKEKFAGLKKLCVEKPEKHTELDPQVESRCQQFKNKSRIIELPNIEIGKELFYIDKYGKRVKSDTVSKLTLYLHIYDILTDSRYDECLKRIIEKSKVDWLESEVEK